MNNNNRGSKILITFLIVVIGLLAISTGYLYAKNVNLQKGVEVDTADSRLEDSDGEDTIDLSPSTSVSPSAAISSTPSAVSPSPTPTSSATPTKTTTATTGEKYTVKSGDTMYSIALKYNINWITLAEANGLTEETANNIKIGQVLVIPAK